MERRTGSVVLVHEKEHAKILVQSKKIENALQKRVNFQIRYNLIPQWTRVLPNSPHE
jgi:hypothetical protein